MFLAQALSATSTVEVWDCDPQGSATEWYFRSQENSESLPFSVETVNIAKLKRATTAAEYVVIDTGPADARGIDPALSIRQVAVLPTAPSGMDLERLYETEAVAARACPAYALLTLVDRRTSSAETGLNALARQNIGHFETVIPMLTRIRHAYGHGLSELFGYEKIAFELKEAMQW